MQKLPFKLSYFTRFSLNSLLPFIVLCAGWFSTSGQAQLSGSLFSNNDEPLVGANVLLLDPNDSTLIKGNAANQEGHFQIENIKPGSYLIAFSMTGFSTKLLENIKVDAQAQPKDLGVIRLEEAVNELNEAIVTGRKPPFELKLDRLVVNVHNSIMARGGTALDVLEKTSGVTVNRQNNIISMGGQSGVIVIINGKQNRMPISAAVEMLKGLSANNVEKIELFAQPPAKFDAEGNAGLINIVLKQSTDKGLNGSYNLTAGYGRKEKLGAGFHFNLRSGKWNLFGNYSYLYDNTIQSFNYNRKVQNNGSLIQTIGISDRDPVQINHNGRLALDYNLSSRTLIGLLFAGYNTKWDMTAQNNAVISEDQMPFLNISTPNWEINHWQHLMGNLNFNHTFQGGQSISVNLDRLYYHDDNPSFYNNNLRDGNEMLISSNEIQVEKKTPITINVAKIDYSQQIGEHAHWDLGVKATGSVFDNDVNIAEKLQDQWMTDPDLSGSYRLKEDIAAAYTSLKMKLSQTMDLSVGLRYEYTESNLSSALQENIIDRKYGNFFPSAFISRKLAEDQTAQISYSRRITRPSFNDLAPFIIFLDPYTFISGNTALQPAITNSVKGDYQYKTYMLSLQYSHDRGVITGYQPRVDLETNRSFFMAENLDDMYTLNFTMTAPTYISEWWEMRNNFSGKWQRLKNQDQDGTIELDNKNFSIYSIHTFSLPKGIALELNAIYQSPFLFGKRTLKGMNSISLGIQKNLPNGSLTLNLSDIFNNYRLEFQDDLPELSLDNASIIKYESRVVRLTYTKNFGNKKLKHSRSRKTGSQEEQQRVQ